MESTMARHTCLKLEIPEPIFIKGTWFPSHFHLSITDGLDSWVCDATEEEVRDRAAQWDQPVSTYIQLAEKHLGFQIPSSVYKFTDAGDGNKRLSWTFEKEGTKLEWRWKCQSPPDSKKTTTSILDFLMDANIRLSMGKNREVKTSCETENNLAMDVLDRGNETESQENKLVWDPNKQTVAASEDWWDEKIKAVPAVEKFRNSGIEPDLCSKYDFMFTGSSAWPTASAVFIDEEESDGNLMQPNVNIGPAEHVEGSGDLGDEPTSVESLDEMLTGAYIDRDSLQLEEQRNDKKQKRVDESGTQSVKKGRNQSGGTVKLSRKLDRLMATVESGGSVTSRRRDAQGCSIIEVMDELHCMPDIVKGSGLHVFASEFFLLRTRREMWFAMREPKAKINWLKTMYDKSVANQ
ncbi:DNA REPAIR PROTEIN XRCC4 [Salix koriyanagi]|uniref:DNA REPAIR PROTEIN XRCC4 n=1 Tax=Salix koriyanagi TaxID=2511006 RepID=A0A9Q0WR75_9ROSI|nr:DNA REPAIR PROTEIN XRCC4 [Salix koriyanagi]